MPRSADHPRRPLLVTRAGADAPTGWSVLALTADEHGACGRGEVPVRFLPTNDEILILDAGVFDGAVLRVLLQAAWARGLAPLVLGREDTVPRPPVLEDAFLPPPDALADAAQLGPIVRGASVLITGAGGDIGLALAARLLALQPAALHLLGHGEHSLLRAIASLEPVRGRTALVPVIADHRDARAMARACARARPVLLIHAAAHKHLPLMEGQIAEAIANNAVGTAVVVEAALAAGVERLVCISTDKAVQPASVLGATKQLAERVVRNAGTRSGRAYGAVRFANVLGSRGSVVPRFAQLIAARAPLPVTGAGMQRYFTTRDDAVERLLHLAARLEAGALYTLDGGAPVPIAELAAMMIHLADLRPGIDVEVRTIDARPGERTVELLLAPGTRPAATAVPRVWQVDEPASDPAELLRALEDALDADADEATLRGLLGLAAR